MFLKLKNSYLIYILLKSSNVFERDSYNIVILEKTHSKI